MKNLQEILKEKNSNKKGRYGFSLEQRVGIGLSIDLESYKFLENHCKNTGQSISYFCREATLEVLNQNKED